MPSRISEAISELLRTRLALSDDEIGRELRRESISAVRKKANDGSGGPSVNELGVDYRLQELRAAYVGAAVSHAKEAQYTLALVLAIDGDYRSAGALYRAFFTPVIGAATKASYASASRRYALATRNLAKKEAQIAREKRWYATGLELRRREKTWPVRNGALARKIAQVIGDRPNSIRVVLPALGLDAATWKKLRSEGNSVKRPTRRKFKRKRLSVRSL